MFFMVLSGQFLVASGFACEMDSIKNRAPGGFAPQTPTRGKEDKMQEVILPTAKGFGLDENLRCRSGYQASCCSGWRSADKQG